jgi:hypothetical protein
MNSRGYWVGKSPRGLWGLFWSPSPDAEWHRLVGEFRDLAMANHAAETFPAQSDTKESPEVTKPAPPKPTKAPAQSSPIPKLHPQLEEKRQAIVADLPELLSGNPLGVTSGIIMHRYGLNYNDATSVLRNIDSAGLAKWVYVDGRGGGKRMFALDRDVQESDLSVNQEKVLRTLISNADQHRCVEMSFLKISELSGVPHGSISTIIWALSKKNYIMVARPASRDGKSSAVLQLLPPAENLPPLPETISKQAAE